MYYKNEKELNMCLTNDALFKGYYSNASNLSTLLSLILKEKIKPNDINYQPNEIIVEFEGKKPRFDLRVSILNELDISKEETPKEEDLQDIIEEESLDDTLNELDIKEEDKPDVLEDTPNDEELELEM